jgi:spore coat-associated protein N
MHTDTATTTPRRGRRLLVPLATLAAAGALIVGSGADFTSASDNSASAVASGTLTQSNSRSGAAIFDVTNVKPGDSVTGSVTITNTGTLPAIFEVVETAENGFVNDSLLNMRITEQGPAGNRVFFDGPFGDLADVTELGRFAAGEARTYTYVVTLSQDAGNEEQGKSATASYRWNSIQTSENGDVDQRPVPVVSSHETNG